ncbi:hypothetical protein CRE_10811 [Caenorhabditis remanei]|uniref:C3HC-type domain-containing protein n=1 Tax=Caenorhabditis remanei TaxID=31234 RepID=E3M501_CAERE|nr:hypothetical protein CRE_10811 [Caenorhabditis remanei]
MEVDSANSRHAALLKRKATDSINEILNYGQSSTSPQKRTKKTAHHKIRDIDAYKKIIKTYKAPTWYGCAVTPRDLADFGWACVKKDCVQCVECEQYLNTSLPNICKVSFNVYNSSLQDIHQKLTTAHRTTCKLRTGAPPFRITEPSSKEIMEGVQGRLTDIKNIEEDEFKVDIPSDLHLPKLEGVSDKFMYVAILGWFVSKPKRGALIFCCDYCARELAIRTGNKFDAIHNHERWCPRIDSDEHGETSWQSDINIVMNTKNYFPHHNKYHGSAIYREAMAARRLLDNSLSTIISPSLITPPSS